MLAPNVILWIYIALLLVGGIIGFLKAKSQMSLYMSCAFAAALTLCALPNILEFSLRANLANGLMAALLVVFVIRLGKTKKFMPAGLMLIVTIVALVLRNVNF